MVSGPSLQQQLDQKVQEIRQAVSGISDDEALSRPGGAEWSAKQVLSHLAGPEGESPTGLLERCLKEDTPTLEIEQGVSAFTPEREKAPIGELLAKVESQYGELGTFLAGLNQDQLNRPAHVPLLKETPIGEYTTVGMVAGAIINFHLSDHVQQLQRLAS
jgi:hypothetical protein